MGLDSRKPWFYAGSNTLLNFNALVESQLNQWLICVTKQTTCRGKIFFADLDILGFCEQVLPNIARTERWCGFSATHCALIARLALKVSSDGFIAFPSCRQSLLSFTERAFSREQRESTGFRKACGYLCEQICSHRQIFFLLFALARLCLFRIRDKHL